MTSIISSQQVSFSEVNRFLAELLEQVDDWPMLGTPAWCDLSADDAVKWAAVFDAAQHWALRLETCQEARADASRAVAGAADWSAISREINQRTAFYDARSYLRREAS
jgi:Protein of unknown function (DUF2742)